jgi:hypothetical protein
MFFAHVGKKQPYNREMFREMADKKITLIDYEYLTTDKGDRVVAFGRWAGIVGAYNGLRARGIRTNRFRLKPAYKCHDLEEMWAGLKLIALKPGLKILVTGGGRVALGAMETLGECNDIVEINADDFLNRTYDVPVMCRIGPEIYTKRKDGSKFVFDHFVKEPGQYESAFLPFARVTDVLITGHYWDPRSPVFFTREDMKHPEFRISVIADISCDINGPVPSTLRATTIADPFYGYNPFLEKEEAPFTQASNITVMSIDNLPGELPRDASHDFGTMLMSDAVDDLLTSRESPMLERAAILNNGKLTAPFAYLEDYLNFDTV